MVKKCLNCGEVKTQSILNFGSIPITSLLSNEESFPLNYGKCEKCFVVSTINAIAFVIAAASASSAVISDVL